MIKIMHLNSRGDLSLEYQKKLNQFGKYYFFY